MSSKAALILPLPQAGQTRHLPPQQRDAAWRSWPVCGAGVGFPSAHPRWKDLSHSNGGSKFGKGVGKCQGFGLGEQKTSTHLSIWLQEAGTGAKRGPSVTLQSCQVAGLGQGVGDSHLAWVLSGQGGNGATLRGWEVWVFCFKVFQFFLMPK